MNLHDHPEIARKQGDRMQPEFESVTGEAVRRSKAVLGPRFSAAYLHGSVFLGDAVPGVSDLDLYIVTNEPAEEAVRLQLTALEAALQRAYPVVSEVHLAVQDKAALREDAFARFVLRYNAVLLDGEDAVRRLEEAGAERMVPEAAMAKGRLGFAESCFADARGGMQPACTGPIPEEPCWAARKFARYFVVVEGAYFLMSRGRFRSFRAEEVLSALREEAPDFGEQLALTERVLQDAETAKTGGEAFLRSIRPLTEWMFRNIENT